MIPATERIIAITMIAFIIATNGRFDDWKMLEYFQKGYWDGSYIETENDSIEVVDRSLYHRKTEQWSFFVDISWTRCQEYKVFEIVESTYKGKTGLWYLARPRWNPDNDTLLCFASLGNDEVKKYSFPKEEEAGYYIKNGYIIVIDNYGNKLLKVKISTGKAKRYKN